MWRLERHEQLKKMGLVALADEADDSAAMWASAAEHHRGTTVRQLLPLLPPEGGRQGLQGLATVGDDGSVAVWTNSGR